MPFYFLPFLCKQFLTDVLARHCNFTWITACKSLSVFCCETENCLYTSNLTNTVSWYWARQLERHCESYGASELLVHIELIRYIQSKNRIKARESWTFAKISFVIGRTLAYSSSMLLLDCKHIFSSYEARTPLEIDVLNYGTRGVSYNLI